MHHCVGAYRASIPERPSSIWSMKSTRGHLVRRMTTIQLDPATRRIVECRGPCNRPPKPAEREILERWAAENGLLVDVDADWAGREQVRNGSSYSELPPYDQVSHLGRLLCALKHGSSRQADLVNFGHWFSARRPRGLH